MRAVIAYAARDLRVETMAVEELGLDDIRVRIKAGGICGSDLHYFNHGGFGAIVLKQPMALGHEIAGIVEATGREAGRIKVGDPVAVSPSRPCNQCQFCLGGQQNHCLDMRFYGSAMRFPHVQGAFREVLVCAQAQAHMVEDHVSMGEAAMAEPLAVCLHAVRQAGSILGKNILVTGSGPIGTLAVMAARRAGAANIVATDVADGALAFARKVGADTTINIAADAGALTPYASNKGFFDVVFEASGNAAALRGALEVVRPGGIIVQLGLGGEMILPINTIVAKELQLRGTFRFHEEFALAVTLINKRLVDVQPLISATLPFTEPVRAFELALDRSQSMKVQLSF